MPYAVLAPTVFNVNVKTMLGYFLCVLIGLSAYCVNQINAQLKNERNSISVPLYSILLSFNVILLIWGYVEYKTKLVSAGGRRKTLIER